MTDHTVVYMCPIQWSSVLLTMWFGLGGFAGGKELGDLGSSHRRNQVMGRVLVCLNWKPGFWFVWLRIRSQNWNLNLKSGGKSIFVICYNHYWLLLFSIIICYTVWYGIRFLFVCFIVNKGCITLCNTVLGFFYFFLLRIKDVLLSIICCMITIVGDYGLFCCQ